MSQIACRVQFVGYIPTELPGGFESNDVTLPFPGVPVEGDRMVFKNGHREDTAYVRAVEWYVHDRGVTPIIVVGSTPRDT